MLDSSIKIDVVRTAVDAEDPGEESPLAELMRASRVPSTSSPRPRRWPSAAPGSRLQLGGDRNHAGRQQAGHAQEVREVRVTPAPDRSWLDLLRTQAERFAQVVEHGDPAREVISCRDGRCVT